MKLIPAIDIIDGACVRLKQGDYQQKTCYHEDPLEVARHYEAVGLRYLHLVDLDGAKASKVVNLKVLERIAHSTSLCIDFGGGIKSTQDLDSVLNAGASQVTCGSIAVKDPQLVQKWLETYGSEKLILGADSRDGYIAVSGWQESSEQKVSDFIKSYLSRGFTTVISTDITRDGMMLGASSELYKNLIAEMKEASLPFNLIASGGIASLEEVKRLNQMGLSGAIIGKALYEGAFTAEALGRLQEEL